MCCDRPLRTGSPPGGSIRSDVRDAASLIRQCGIAGAHDVFTFNDSTLDIPMGLLFQKGEVLRLSTAERCYLNTVLHPDRTPVFARDQFL
jgi:hypothetical protein